MSCTDCWRCRGLGCAPRSIGAAVGVAPVFAGAEFLVAAVVAPDPARGLVVGGNEAVAIAHAAIVCRLHLVPDDEAVGVEAAVVDADRLDLAADHHAIEPRPRPFDPAFEMGAALRDARRAQHAGWDGGEPGFLQLVHARLERQSADRNLVEHRLLERHHVDHDSPVASALLVVSLSALQVNAMYMG